MKLLDIFKKKPTNTGLFTDADFDNLFNVVFVKGVDDKLCYKSYPGEGGAVASYKKTVEIR